MAKEYIEEQVRLIFQAGGIGEIVGELNKLKKKVDEITKGKEGGFGKFASGALRAASGIKGLNTALGGLGRTVKSGGGIGVATQLMKKFINAVISGSEFLYKYDKTLVSLSARARATGRSLSDLEGFMTKVSKATSLTRMETMGLFKEYQRGMRFASLEQFDTMMKSIQDTVGINVEAMEEMKSTIMALGQIDPILADMASKMVDATAEEAKNYKEILGTLYLTGDIKRQEYIDALGLLNATKFLTKEEKRKLDYNKEYLRDIGKVKGILESIKMGFGDLGKAIFTSIIPTPKEGDKKDEGIWGDIELKDRQVMTGMGGGGALGGAYVTRTIKPGEAGYWKANEEAGGGTEAEHNIKVAAREEERQALYAQENLLYRKQINTEIDKTVKAQQSLTIATIESAAITGQIDYGAINKSIDETISLIDSQVASKQILLDLLKDNKEFNIDEVLNNNKILEVDKEVYENMKAQGISQITAAKNGVLQKDLEEDIVSATKEKLQVSLKVLEVRKFSRQVAQNEADLAGKLVQLADNYAIGVGASMELRLKEYNFLTKVTEQHEMDLQQIRNRISLEGDNLALRAEELEIEKKIADVTLQQAASVKSMRSGWIEAIAAMNTGAGVFTEIIMSAEKGTAMAARLSGIIPTPYSGKYGAGAGYGTSEKFSAYQQFNIGGRRGGERWQDPYSMYGGEGVIKELERGNRSSVFRRARQQSQRSMSGGGVGLSLFGGHQGSREAYYEGSGPISQASIKSTIDDAVNAGTIAGIGVGTKAVIAGLEASFNA